jgi:DNA (cytosine-5)-methyltransferase 1
MNHLDLFSGIGGFALATEWAGIETVAFVEIDKFCQKVLEKNFNGQVITDTEGTGKYRIIRNVEQEEGRNAKFNGNYKPPIYPDITKFDGTPYRGAVDIVSGGFPCQPFSCAGKRRGKEDNRYLWPEMLRVIKECNPKWVIAENVPGIINIRSMEQQDGEFDVEGEMVNAGNDDVISTVFIGILNDLEQAGYEVQTFCVPACAVNAPHRRDRVWIVANALSNTQRGTYRKNIREHSGKWNEPNIIERNEMGSNFTNQNSDAPNSNRQRSGTQRYDDNENRQTGNERWQGQSQHRIDGYYWDEPWLAVATRLCRMDDGVSAQMDGLKLSKSRHRVERLKALGNAIVPQVAFQIFKAIMEVEKGV